MSTGALVGTFTFFTTGPYPKSVIKRVIEVVILAATVFPFYTAAATENVARVTLAALSAGMSTVQRSGEVGAGGGTGTRAHLVTAELWAC